MRRTAAVALIFFFSTHTTFMAPRPVVVIGAGIAGLSAALEAAQKGSDVIVVDASTVFGGHAVMSGGHVAIVDTPLQRAKGIHDSPALAAGDFVKWGEDANRDWVDYYAKHSREEIYDWLTKMGVRFDDLFQYSGNSVPRAHITHGAGLGLVLPIYRACLATKRVDFRWHTRVISLKNGVETIDTRDGSHQTIRAAAVIIATGGYQSNVDFVLAHWPAWMKRPAKILAGSGIESRGSGLDLATGRGGALRELDHQWNYETGLPDPRSPGRGLNAFNSDSIWVNLDGKRFVDERATRPERLRSVLAQRGSTYWMIFDAAGCESFAISGTDWQNRQHIDQVILDDQKVTKRAQSIVELARMIHVPVATLVESTKTLTKPPFYAIQFFPLARKSMGGIAVDRSCRVLDTHGQPIFGLFAAGESTGFGGINGKAGLEGTFLGPAIVMGRVAGREAAIQSPRVALPPHRFVPPVGNKQCMSCHAMKALVATSRPGYWHFEMVHRVVLQQSIECHQCHRTHAIDPVAQSETCARCHGAD